MVSLLQCGYTADHLKFFFLKHIIIKHQTITFELTIVIVMNIMHPYIIA